MLNLLAAAVIGGLCGIIAIIVCLIMRLKLKKLAYITLFSAYIGALIGITVCAGASYMEPRYNLIPFDTIIFHSTANMGHTLLQMFGNIVIFIPMGVFLNIGRMILKKSILTGFLASLAIEVTELILMRGVFDTTDLILNTLGTFVGFTIAEFAQMKLRERKN